MCLVRYNHWHINHNHNVKRGVNVTERVQCIYVYMSWIDISRQLF